MSDLPSPVRLRPGDLLAVGIEGLRGRPLRAALSALGIAIGIAAMAAMIGVSTVSRAGLLSQIEALGTNLLTVAPGHTLNGGQARLPEDVTGMVLRIPGVTSASAIGGVPGVTVRRTDRIDPEETSGIGVFAARLDLLGPLGATVRSGTFLNAATARYPAVVLGTVSAERLGVESAGERVYLGGRWFTVAGLLDELPLSPEIDRAALIGWDSAAKLGFDGHPTSVYTRTTKASVGSVGALLAATASPENPDEVKVSRPSDALTARVATENTFNGLLLGLGAIALIVGGVGIANTMVISVLERRQEIGLRRALGATRHQIRLQFLTESVALSLLGGLSGLIFGILASLAYALYNHYPMVLPYTALTIGAAASALIGALSGLYPARRAALLPPTEALSA